MVLAISVTPSRAYSCATARISSVSRAVNVRPQNVTCNVGFMADWQPGNLELTRNCNGNFTARRGAHQVRFPRRERAPAKCHLQRWIHGRLAARESGPYAELKR